jgi:benzoyl-CoA reductase/2-hydroxyglutaryl-CoA dehydratase subunit BcrC/BadD/HgdB
MGDFLLVDATCDGKKKMFELLADIKPLYMLQLPQTAKTPESYAYWLQELYRVRALLEQRTGVAITDENLLGQIRIWDDHPPPQSGNDALSGHRHPQHD